MVAIAIGAPGLPRSPARRNSVFVFSATIKRVLPFGELLGDRRARVVGRVIHHAKFPVAVQAWPGARSQARAGPCRCRA
eukprot:4192164-Pleurochrysis_carterae.AAC.1